MAVTKIWPVKDSVGRVVGYAKNPEKTEFSEMKRVLHYAENGEKTVAGEEKILYVTGVNCRAETAAEEMIAVQERFGKTTGNVAYHAYQSFKTGEVSPQLAHQIGVELAQKMWNDWYQVLVATHFNTGTYHNHFVVNAVGMWDGKKFDCNEGAYWKLRSISDKLCAEHGLTVIQNPKGKTPRKLYFAEKNGEPTRYNLMREAIDKALTMCYTEPKLFEVMKRLGYIIDLDPYKKYGTIRSVNSQKATRLYRLGKGYDRDEIYDRMRENLHVRPGEVNYRYSEFMRNLRSGVTVQRARCRLHGSFRTVKKVTGLRALYLHYCYLLGMIPKHRPHEPLSPELREACRFLDIYTEQIQFISKHKLHDLPAVEAFIDKSQSEIKLMTDYRKTLYRKIERCRDPEEQAALVSKRNGCTKVLAGLRKDIRTAGRVLKDHPKIKENVRIEVRMRRERYAPQKQKRRGYER